MSTVTGETPGSRRDPQTTEWVTEMRAAIEAFDCICQRRARALIAEVERLQGENAELRKGLEPFAEFARAWNANPIRGVDVNELYAIHGGRHEKIGASISLADLQEARRLLDPIGWERSDVEGDL